MSLCFFSLFFYNNNSHEFFFFFSSRRRHTRSTRDWSSDVCSSDLFAAGGVGSASSECRSPTPWRASLGGCGSRSGSTASRCRPATPLCAGASAGARPAERRRPSCVSGRRVGHAVDRVIWAPTRSSAGRGRSTGPCCPTSCAARSSGSPETGPRTRSNRFSATASMATSAIDEVRRQEFFRAGPVMRKYGRGKRWLLLHRWRNVRGSKRRELQELFDANRRLYKAYVLREQLDWLWTYKTRRGVADFLEGWQRALRWQRLPEMKKLSEFLLRHFEGIAAYCDHPVRFGVVESLNTTIKAVLRRARGMRDEQMLVLKLKWATAHPIRSSRDLERFITRAGCI